MKHLLPLFLFMLLLSGCKKDDWIDWKTQNELWLEQNKEAHANDPNFHVLSNNVQYVVNNPGNLTDSKPDKESTVYIDYSGKLITGVEFDSGENAEFAISNMISGLGEGMKKMHCGGDFTFYIPQDVAYAKDGNGKEGSAYYIPPYSVVIFDVHLVAITK